MKSKISQILAVLCVLAGCLSNLYAQPAAKPKNIILMIGDGMGLSQVSAGLYTNMNKLNLEQFNVIGLHKSYSADDLITDSAAGATAFASGVKTYNAAIGVNTDTAAVGTILEEAENKGKATGMVVTCILPHATPASFVAHQKHRKMYEEIAADFMKVDLDFMAGGGRKYFDSRRSDKRDLVGEMSKKGYQVLDFSEAESFSALSAHPDKKKKVVFTADDDPKKAMEGRNYLPAATQSAIANLDAANAEGFFLMIEGSQIDWGGHSNDAPYLISEMLDFDQAIGKALEFAKKDGNTLVIVTADHETGGFSINEGSELGKLVTGFTTTHHTGTLIPVYAFGPGAEAFQGIYENTAIYQKMRTAFGWR